MDELFDFVNRPEKPKYDLLKIAIAHHRFVWIHPFSNGNGRTVRLFTYALLIKSGFAIHEERILNPTAVFCSNRKIISSIVPCGYRTDDGLFSWCEYVLTGLKKEIEKIDRLSDYSFLKTKSLFPQFNNRWKEK